MLAGLMYGGMKMAVKIVITITASTMDMFLTLLL